MVLIGLGVLILIGMIVGFYDSLFLRIVIEINTFTTFYYNVGISFIAYPEPDHIEEEFTIGLFFVNFVIVFYKEYE